MSSHRIHRIHRIWQRGYGRDAIPSYICEHPCRLWEALLCQRFCEFRAHLWEVLLSQKFLCVPCVLWEYLFSHGIHRIHRICQRGYGRDAIPSYICAHPCHLWEALLCQKFLCVPCVLWELLHRLFGWCSGDSCTLRAVSVGMAGMPYPPTSVNIRVICGRLFSARGSVYSVHSVGDSSPFVRLVQQRLLHPLAESTEVVGKSHHLTISPQQHPFTSNPAFCMSSQYCGYDFVTTCGSLMRSPGNTIAAGANAIAMRWSS